MYKLPNLETKNILPQKGTGGTLCGQRAEAPLNINEILRILNNVLKTPNETFGVIYKNEF